MTQTLAPAPKLTAVEKRSAFIAEVAQGINGHYKLVKLMEQAGQEFPAHPTHEAFVATAKRIAEEGPALGRTSRWHNACAFAQDEIDANPGDEAHARWAVVQQSVYLVHATD